MNRPFTKMHGLGNDFAVLDARRDPFVADPEGIRVMADRHRGIGFDQLLTIEQARDSSCLARYGIWNADGQAVGQCGNGVRCVAAWLHREGLLPVGQSVNLESPSGPVVVRLADTLSVAVNMGEPRFAPEAIPFQAPSVDDAYTLEVDGESVVIGAVSMGNPHAVVVVDDPASTHVERLGPALTNHARFPEGCNAGFVALRGRGAIDLRVHERGSGWTEACGTGACAAMAVLRRRNQVDATVAVTLPGGILHIMWNGKGDPLWMTGPAAFVFTGTWPAGPAGAPAA